MKKPIVGLICIVISMFFSCVFGQVDQDVLEYFGERGKGGRGNRVGRSIDYRNMIRVNPMGLMVNNPSIYYDRQLTPKVGLECTLGVTASYFLLSSQDLFDVINGVEIRDFRVDPNSIGRSVGAKLKLYRARSLFIPPTGGYYALTYHNRLYKGVDDQSIEVTDLTFGFGATWPIDSRFSMGYDLSIGRRGVTYKNVSRYVDPVVRQGDLALPFRIYIGVGF